MSCGFIVEIEKDPAAVLDYVISWSDWLPTGDTISAAAFTVPTVLTKDSETNTTTTATVRLSGGTAGDDYDVVCQITTAGGRTDERTMRVQVRNR